MNETRMIVVCIAAKHTPLMATITATDNALHIISVEKLPNSLAALTARMGVLKDKAAELSAELVIEDHSGMFTSYGRSIRIDTKGADSRPVLVAAMERYKALTSVNAITYPDGMSTQLKISNNLYNLKHSDNGEVSYMIDWDNLTDEKRVFLLSVYAAMCQNVFQVSFLERVLGLAMKAQPPILESDKSKPSPYVNKGNGGRVVTL